MRSPFTYKIISSYPKRLCLWHHIIEVVEWIRRKVRWEKDKPGNLKEDCGRYLIPESICKNLHFKTRKFEIELLCLRVTHRWGENEAHQLWLYLQLSWQSSSVLSTYWQCQCAPMGAEMWKNENNAVKKTELYRNQMHRQRMFSLWESEVEENIHCSHPNPSVITLKICHIVYIDSLY